MDFISRNNPAAESKVNIQAANYQQDNGVVANPRSPAAKRRRLNTGAAAVNGTSNDPDTPSSSQAGDNLPMNTTGRGSFSMVATAPRNHSYIYDSWKSPDNPKTYHKRIKEEIEILKQSLPVGITVKGYEDRMDLFSVMIEGPEGTPYEDGLFFFDVHLPQQYPKRPPRFRYISYCSDVLNPNLYTDGTVCVSLLGTWPGQDVEVWSAKQSNLLRVLVSIQGLILVPEPFFNEPGYEYERGTEYGIEESRSYNEEVMPVVIESLTAIAEHPPQAFRDEVTAHILSHAARLFNRLKTWINASEAWEKKHKWDAEQSYHNKKCCKNLKPSKEWMPEFPLLPASRDFCCNLRSELQIFRDTLMSLHPSIYLPKV